MLQFHRSTALERSHITISSKAYGVPEPDGCLHTQLVLECSQRRSSVVGPVTPSTASQAILRGGVSFPCDQHTQRMAKQYLPNSTHMCVLGVDGNDYSKSFTSLDAGWQGFFPSPLMLCMYSIRICIKFIYIYIYLHSIYIYIQCIYLYTVYIYIYVKMRSEYNKCLVTKHQLRTSTLPNTNTRLI